MALDTHEVLNGARVMICFVIIVYQDIGHICHIREDWQLSQECCIHWPIHRGTTRRNQNSPPVIQGRTTCHPMYSGSILK